MSIDELEGPFDFEIDDEDYDTEVELGNRLRGQKFILGSSLNPSAVRPR